MCGQQCIELRSAGLQSFKEQSNVIKLLRVGRIVQQFDGFLVRCGFFFRNVFEAQIVIGRVVGEQHAIVEGILAAQIVSEHDMREFMRKHGS